MKVLWIGKTGQANVWYHLYPFIASKTIEKIYVVRYKKPQRDISSSKVKFYLYKESGFVVESFRLLLTGAKVLINKDIDYVVTFNLVPWGVFGWILAKIFRKKFVLGLIGTDFNHYVLNCRTSIFLKFVIRNSNIVFVTGNQMKEDLLKLMPILMQNTHVFPHCLPEDLIRLKSNPFKEEGVINIVTISALTENKRTIDVVKAVEILCNDKYDVKLTIVGDGNEFKNLMSYIKEHKLEKLVELAGYRLDTKKYLTKADIFIQASLNEGLSLSLIESMGMRVIPIVTNAGSEKDIILDGVNGLFIHKNNPQDIANKVKLIANKEFFYKLQSGIQNSSYLFDINRVVSVIDAVNNKLRQ
jgi:glycosyltransferase involved in cell wall biosynthesis